MTATAFYRRTGERTYEPTKATESPWSPDQQHGGPPSALLVRAVEEIETRDGLHLASASIDLLGTIPRTEVTVDARVVRPGRRVELVEATLSAGGRHVAVARCWFVERTDSSSVTTSLPTPPPALPPSPEEPVRLFDGVADDWGYGNALDWRFDEGGRGTPGHGAAWVSTRIPLVEGETTSPAQRTAIVADSANGISAALDLREWLFVPTAVQLTLHRLQGGDWMHMAARTTIGPDGAGSTLAYLSDEDGPLGTCAQPLVVRRR